MIIVVTGQPGAGKTALVVDMLANDPQFQGRPLFVGGIDDLRIEHLPVPPVDEWTEARTMPEDSTISLQYFTFPPRSVIVLDEAQRIYRPRAASAKVPPEVQAFETHRHTGVDFILLTQHPGLLDSNIRKLAGKHIHIAVTPFGRKKYEWTKCVDPDLKSERQIAASSNYSPPKRVFDLYKSAELHTKIKVRLPGYIYVAGFGLVGVLALAYFALSGIKNKMAPVDLQTSQPSFLAVQSHGHEDQLTPAEYIKSTEPRLPGLYYTAPRYDQVTKPVTAPYPSICVLNHQTNRCRCLDQQGNHYNAPDGLCRSIVANGLFRDFSTPEDTDGPRPAESKPDDARQHASAVD